VRRPEYPQADPPDPVTCLLYVLVVVFLLGTVAVILYKALFEPRG
jgi:hypothetical protein